MELELGVAGGNKGEEAVLDWPGAASEMPAPHTHGAPSDRGRKLPAESAPSVEGHCAAVGRPAGALLSPAPGRRWVHPAQLRAIPLLHVCTWLPSRVWRESQVPRQQNHANILPHANTWVGRLRPPEQNTAGGLGD